MTNKLSPSRLPPLQSLAFFESAARHLNFTSAARELGTTQPAVSHRIASLEDDLGTSLFVREHRGVSLTRDGIDLFESVHRSLGDIEKATGQIRARRHRRTLTVATDFGFASYWLMPRLKAMRELVPDLDVRIVTSQETFDLKGGQIDLVIAYGSGSWADASAQMLFPERVVPVCSPHFYAEHIAGKTDVSLGRLPLLHLETTAPERWLTWKKWFKGENRSEIASSQDLTFNNFPLVIQAAIAGQGVALGWLPLIDASMEASQLVRATPQIRTTENACYLILPDKGFPSLALEKFCDWIRRECALGSAGT